MEKPQSNDESLKFYDVEQWMPKGTKVKAFNPKDFDFSKVPKIKKLTKQKKQ